jgi:hypothetical protein
MVKAKNVRLRLTDSSGDFSHDRGADDLPLTQRVQDLAVDDRVDPVAQERDEGQDRILQLKEEDKCRLLYSEGT